MLKIHTFEMKKVFCMNNELEQFRNNLNDIGFQYNNTENSQIYTYYAKKGIVIVLFRCKFVLDYVIVKINPQKVFGEEQLKSLFDLNKNRFMECLKMVEEIFRRRNIMLNEFRISRIDFTIDIKFERSEIIDIYIKLLNKAGTPYKYSYKDYGGVIYKDSYEIENDFHSVAVYNKEKESRQRNKRNFIMQGVMRIEVRMIDAVEMRQIFLAETLDFDKIITMQENAVKILENVFMDGFYIKLEKTKKILYKEYHNRKTGKRQKNKIEKMIGLSEKLAIHRSAHDCIRGENMIYAYNTIKDIKCQFKEKRINLISISANEHISVLPDLKYILGIKTESEIRKDNEFIIDNGLIKQIPKYSIL